MPRTIKQAASKDEKEIPISLSDAASKNIFETLEETPRYLISVAKHFDQKSSLEPITPGKRSFRETLIHLLNIESLNYITIYPAFLLNKPTVYLFMLKEISTASIYMQIFKCLNCFNSL